MVYITRAMATIATYSPNAWLKRAKIAITALASLALKAMARNAPTTMNAQVASPTVRPMPSASTRTVTMTASAMRRTLGMVVLANYKAAQKVTRGLSVAGAITTLNVFPLVQCTIVNADLVLMATATIALKVTESQTVQKKINGLTTSLSPPTRQCANCR
jgi:hypothetical protein